MSFICIPLFVLGGCRHQGKRDERTFKVDYTWDGKMRVVSMTDTLSNQEVDDPRLRRRVVEEGNRVLPRWMNAAKLKRTTGTFHVRFLAEGQPEIVEALDGVESAGSEFMKDPDVTPLMTAAHEGQVDALEQLVKTGQNVNVSDQLGNTALMAAGSSRNLKALRFLLDHGAEINARNRDGETALTFSASSGQLDMINELFRRGAVFNCANPVDGETLLVAERQGNLQLASTLKKKGVHCN